MQQNTISNNTFTSSVKDISQGNIEYGITAPQFYSCLICLTLVIIVAIFSITRLIQTAMLRMNFITPKLIKDIKKQIVAELK
jgi:hypothetical protein